MSDIAIALNRFGLGARLDDQGPAGEVRAALLRQLDRFDARPDVIAAAPTRRSVATQLADYFDELRGLRGQMRLAEAPSRMPGQAPLAMDAMPAATMTGSARPGGDANDELANLPQQVRRYIRREARSAYVAMIAARTNAALTAPAPFVERLVHFWANHFAISIDKLPVIGLGGLLEFEAIRPHVLGKFRDMLVAVEQHPAMLLYLDQAQSIGPASPVTRAFNNRGGRRLPGLNENLAREILELHTLGVDGGYGQEDVTELARALTGWTVHGLGRGRGARAAGLVGPPGDFHFAAPLHEPGPRQVARRHYDHEGVHQGLAILSDLATHPATARHLATKLARHFSGDAPPASLVQQLERTYLESGGDLSSLYRVLIAAPEVWVTKPLKFKTPWEWSISALRAVGARQLEGQPVAGLMNQLGQPVWRPGSPAGWDDIATAWAGPDALLRRVEAAEWIAGRAGDTIDARQLAARILPRAVGPATTEAIARAESPAQGLALLLVAPEFLRR